MLFTSPTLSSDMRVIATAIRIVCIAETMKLFMKGHENAMYLIIWNGTECKQSAAAAAMFIKLKNQFTACASICSIKECSHSRNQFNFNTILRTYRLHTYFVCQNMEIANETKMQ